MEFLFMKEISIPITQIALLLLLSTVALFVGRVKLGLWNQQGLFDRPGLSKHQRLHPRLFGIRHRRCGFGPCGPDP